MPNCAGTRFFKFLSPNEPNLHEFLEGGFQILNFFLTGTLKISHTKDAKARRFFRRVAKATLGTLISTLNFQLLNFFQKPFAKSAFPREK